MNLHGMISGIVGNVNPSQTVVISPSNGYVTGSDGKRTPSYGPPITVMAQVQGLTEANVFQTQGLNIASEMRTVYLPGAWNGVVRADQKGGDLMTLADGTHWLVVQVLEAFPDWCKVAITRQSP